MWSILNLNNNDSHAFVCSEFILRAYYEAGLLENEVRMLPGIDRDFTLPSLESTGQRVSPQDVYMNRDSFGSLLSEVAS